MDFNSVDELLDFAIGNEEGAVKLYTDLAEKAKDSHIRALLKEFADQERGHKVKLTEIKKGGRLKPTPEKVMDLKIADYMEDVAPTSELEYQELLIIAMQQEKAAYRLYIDLAAQAADPDIRDTLLALAQEEARHKLQFEIHYDADILKED